MFEQILQPIWVGGGGAIVQTYLPGKQIMGMGDGRWEMPMGMGRLKKKLLEDWSTVLL